MAPVCHDVLRGVLQRDRVHGPLGLVGLAGGVVDDEGVAAGLVGLPPEELLRVRRPAAVVGILVLVLDGPVSRKRRTLVFVDN